MKNEDQPINIDDIAARLLKTPVGDEIDKIIASSRAARKLEVRAKGQFPTPVIYVQPTFKELKRRFPCYVHPKFAEGRMFKMVDNVDDSGSRKVTFVYFRPRSSAGNVSVTSLRDQMGSESLRPALYEELLCFAKKYPDELHKYMIVALGSTRGVIHGAWHAAFVWSDDDGDRLDLRDALWCDWSGPYRFLAVRESA